MPRRNNRKDYPTSKNVVFFDNGGSAVYRPECVGCAFAGYSGSCTTSDGTCLITIPTRKGQDDNNAHKR